MLTALAEQTRRAADRLMPPRISPDRSALLLRGWPTTVADNRKRRNVIDTDAADQAACAEQFAMALLY